MAMTQDLIAGIDHLDPLPITVKNLLSVLGDEATSPREIANIIEYDQAIAATLLRVANSAVFGGRIQIERIGDAVIRLGIDQVLSIALGSHFRTMSAPAELYDLTEDDLWLHSAVSSLAAKEIIKACPSAGIPQIATVAALAHDIGKLVLVRYVDADMQQILDVAEQKGLTFVEAERELFGFDHAEVGGAVAEKWCFPEGVRDAITRHHEVFGGDPTPTLDTVKLANMVAKTVGAGLGAEGMNIHAESDSLKRLDLRFKDFGRICSEVITQMDGLKALYAA